MKNLKRKFQRILILQTAFIGDVLLTLPLLQSLKKMYPQALIDFIAISSSENILETHPDINQLYIYDKHGKDKGFNCFFRLMRLLKRNKYDLALIPHRSLRSALLVWGANIPVRLGFDKSAGRLLFSQLLPYPAHHHEINRNLSLLTPLGFDANRKVYPKIFFTDEDQKIVESWLATQKLLSLNKSIAIAPGSIWATKRWLPQYFAELINILRKKKFDVILVGGKTDQEIAKTIEELSGLKVLNAVGKFSLRQSALLIKRCRILVTNDSAPLHLAVSVQTPAAAIFGATVPKFGFFPYGERDRVAELHNLSCRPCRPHGGHKCPIGTFECMKNLEPQIVWAEISNILSKT